MTCRFLHCQWHCRQRIAPANRGFRFAHNKNARRRFEGSDRARRQPLPLSGIVPLGRIPNGTIPRKRRAATWTSTTEASKCSLPPGSAAAKPRLLVRSRAFPTRHPASLPGKARPWALSGGLPCPSAAVAGAASASPNPPGRPRGALPASSPWNPTGRTPAQAPRGCCPGRAATRRTRDIPTEFRATSDRRRQFGGDAGPRGPSRIRRSAPPPGISADKPSKEALHRRPIGET